MSVERLKTAAVVLAAGASRRLGQPKQLARLAGETLLGRSVRVADEAGFSPVVVVLGARAEEIATACGHELEDAVVVLNTGWEEGMAASIRTGVRELEETDVDGAVVMTCDQPAVDAAHLLRLTEDGGLLASGYGGSAGIPAYFPRGMFGELMRLTGEGGAKRLLGAAGVIELPGGDLDVDTPAALLAARERFL